MDTSKCLSFTVRDNDSECETRYVVKIRERVEETTEKIMEMAKKFAKPMRCYCEHILGLHFLYIYQKERDEYDVLVYPINHIDMVKNRVIVADYSGRYYTQLFEMVKSRRNLQEWFKDSDDADYILHRILHHLLTSDVIKVLVGRNDELYGFMSVNTTTYDKEYIPTIDDGVVDKESFITFCTDILLMQKIVKSFEGTYDCYCNLLVTKDDIYNRQMVEAVVQELHGRGYQSLGFCADICRDQNQFEMCGFEKDSMFYSRNLSEDKVDGNNGVRYILEI